VRRAEALPVVAGDDDERVLVEAAFAEAREEPAELTVDLGEGVQVPPQVPVVGRSRSAREEVDDRLARRGVVGMVALLRPEKAEEGALAVAVDPLERPIDPGRPRRLPRS